MMDAETLLARRNWLMRHQDAQRGVSSMIERYFQPPSRGTLWDENYRAGEPALICGLAQGWPMAGPLCLKSTIEAAGDPIVTWQAGRAGNPHYELEKHRHEAEGQLSGFLKLLNTGNDAYITASNNNREALRPLLRHMGQVAYLQELDPHWWIGGAGTFTPLHYDLTNNLLIQLQGRKELLLLPPSAAPWLHEDIGVYSAVHDLEDPRKPLDARVQPIREFLNPGDALFVPLGWWHQVRALDFSITLTCTNFIWPNEAAHDFPG